MKKPFEAPLLAKGLLLFILDVRTLWLPLQAWISVLILPQVIVGGYLAWVHGVRSPAGWVFCGRIVSFFVAGEVNLRYRTSKIIGPIMHAPFVVVVPQCVAWLGTEDAWKNKADLAGFIILTSVVTSLALLLDAITLAQWCVGIDVGVFRRGGGLIMYDYLLPIPSLIGLSLVMMAQG